MDKKLVKFAFIPPQYVIALSKKTKSFGSMVLLSFPNLKTDLIQAEYGVDAREYASVCFVVAVINFFVLLLLFSFFGFALRKPEMFFGGLLLSMILGAITFFTNVFYPKMISAKRARKIEADLIPACRQLLIEVRAGVSLFNAMASISDGYGETSIAFKKIVSRTNSGIAELDALADASLESPSQQLRKVLWQISNALKVGGDVGDALQATLGELMHERIEEIKRYGQELSPWTMIYMMASVILPSLGVTMLIVISSFMSISLPPIILPFGIAYLIGFQLFFMNFVKTRRPAV